MAPSSGGVAEKHQYFKEIKRMQWHLGKDTDLSLPAWLGPRKQRIMILGDRGPLFFPFERAQGKRSTKKTMNLQSLCAILAHLSQQKHDLKHEVPSVVNQFGEFLCSHVWHAEFPFGMALVAEACSAWNTCFAADGGGARLYGSSRKGAQQTGQEAAARDAVGGISAGFESCGSFFESQTQSVLHHDGGSGGQFLERFKQDDQTYDTIPDDDKDTEESIGEDAFDRLACESFADMQGSPSDKIPGGRTVEDLPAREVEGNEGQGGQTFGVYCQNFGAFSMIPDPVLEQNTGSDEDAPGEQLQCKLGPGCGKEDSLCLRMLHLPSFLWSLCGTFSGRSGKNCEGRQPVNQRLALTQGTNAHSVVNSSGTCRGLQGELSFDQPILPVLAQKVETQQDSCLQVRDQVADATLSNHRGSSVLDACTLPTGASKDLNHLVTRKGPAVAGERPRRNDVELRAPTGVQNKENHLVTRKFQSVTGERSRCVHSVGCCGEEQCAGQGADLPSSTPRQVPTGEVAGALQHACCARSGCLMPNGEVAGTLQSGCSARSGCQVTTGEFAGALQRACSARSECHVPTGEVAGALQRACNARSGCQMPTGEVADTLQRACCARSGCLAPTGEVAGTQTSCPSAAFVLILTLHFGLPLSLRS